VFVIPQVPGSIPRSIRVDGVLEAFLKRKYVVPVAVLHPIVAGSLALVYLGDGRFDLPKDPAVLDVVALSEAAQQEETTESRLMPAATNLQLLSLESQQRSEPLQKPQDAEEPGGVEEKPAPVSARSGGQM
jgi:hypothetical protein